VGDRLYHLNRGQTQTVIKKINYLYKGNTIESEMKDFLENRFSVKSRKKTSKLQL
jgi:hypothetical protein